MIRWSSTGEIWMTLEGIHSFASQRDSMATGFCTATCAIRCPRIDRSLVVDLPWLEDLTRSNELCLQTETEGLLCRVWDDCGKKDRWSVCSAAPKTVRTRVVKIKFGSIGRNTYFVHEIHVHLAANLCPHQLSTLVDFPAVPRLWFWRKRWGITLLKSARKLSLPKRPWMMGSLMPASFLAVEVPERMHRIGKRDCQTWASAWMMIT